MFQSKEQCRKRSIKAPRLSFIHDALSYCEAEYPLENLVKQRRRWTNGAAFRGVLEITNPRIILDSDHSIIFKLTAFGYNLLDAFTRVLAAISGPPWLASMLYVTVKLLANLMVSVDGGSTMLAAAQSTDPLMLAVGLVPTFAYLTLYALFVIQHTPSAVEQKKAGAPKESDQSYISKWVLNAKTGYCAGLWKMAILANCGLHFLIIAMIAMYGHFNGYMQDFLIAHFYSHMFEAMFLFLLYRRIRMTRTYISLLSLPLDMLGFNVTVHGWFSSYCVARFADCTWGTRATNHDDQSSQAKLTERLGKKISYALLSANLGVFLFIMHHIHHYESAPFNLDGYSTPTLVMDGLTDCFGGFSSSVGGVLDHAFYIWIAAVFVQVAVETNTKGSGRISSGQLFNDESWSPESNQWHTAIFRDIFGGVSAEELSSIMFIVKRDLFWQGKPLAATPSKAD